MDIKNLTLEELEFITNNFSEIYDEFNSRIKNDYEFEVGDIYYKEEIVGENLTILIFKITDINKDKGTINSILIELQKNGEYNDKTFVKFDDYLIHFINIKDFEKYEGKSEDFDTILNLMKKFDELVKQEEDKTFDKIEDILSKNNFIL
jgi:phosphopentomutase